MDEERLARTDKLNLGCGDLPRDGFWNVDIAERPGVDHAFDLTRFPWPLPDNHFEEVQAIDVLEHLPDTIRTVEEIWRVCRDGAEVHIRVPYWNSRWAWMDPQHVRTFHECTFDFFDPSKKYCKQRPYYSPARFRIEYVLFEGTWFFLGRWWYWKVPENRPRRILHAVTKLCDIVHFLQFHLRAIKNDADTPAS
jgi:SAM-dependent methyltransferase